MKLMYIPKSKPQQNPPDFIFRSQKPSPHNPDFWIFSFLSWQNLFFVEDSQRFETVFPIAVDGFLVGAEAGLEDAAGDGRVVDTVTTFAYWETSFSHSQLSRRFIKNPLLQNGEISPHPDPLRRRYMTERAIERRPLPRK